MFKSLASRLSLSYMIIILILLCFFLAGLFFSLRQSPLLYRTTFSRLAIAKAVILPRLQSLAGDEIEQFRNLIKKENSNAQIRAVILSGQGEILFDSEQKSNVSLPLIIDPAVIADKPENQADLYRDNRGKVWFYITSAISSKYYLVLLLQRPAMPLAVIFQDEFLGPLLQAGLFALGLAIILSIAMTQWITKPLKKMVQSAKLMAEGGFQDIPLQGPVEVQQLATALNEMNGKVHQSMQSQRDFIANVSHELKTPITAMQGFAQAISDGTVKGREELKRAGKVILDETSRLHRLVLDLLVLTRLDAGTADLRNESVSINPIIANVIEKFILTARKTKTRIEFNPVGDANVIGDGDRLSQVISNLIDNAIKFSPAKGVIEVISRNADGHVQVRISDEGPGIREADQLRIFDRFYQVDPSRKGGESHGVGLGLAITKQIVQSHKGRIWVESNGFKGSTFIIELPSSKDKRISIQ
jgi:two-component system, OmpR family, sensor kinase